MSAFAVRAFAHSVRTGSLRLAVCPPAPGPWQTFPATHRSESPVRMASAPSSSSAPPPTVHDPLCSAQWLSLDVPDGYLRLDLTLMGGQSFRWHDLGILFWRGAEYREFAGVIHRTAVVLRQLSAEPPFHSPVPVCDRAPLDPVWYHVLSTDLPTAAATTALVRDFFRADTDLRPLIAHFCARDARFAAVFPHFAGARVLRQDPVENLFAFLCSSNNHVRRISAMVSHLAARYGGPPLVADFRGRALHAFPTVAVLRAAASEHALREAGFGYRAAFVVRTAAALGPLGDDRFLHALRRGGVGGRSAPSAPAPGSDGADARTFTREQVSAQLMQLHGIGRKVAGCIALMSLDRADEIPCDTHVWQICVRDYMPALRAKSLTDRVYTQIGDFFRGRFGEYAGWAHCYLFIAELGDFKDRLPVEKRRAMPGKPKKQTHTKVRAKAQENGTVGRSTTPEAGHRKARKRTRKTVQQKNRSDAASARWSAPDVKQPERQLKVGQAEMKRDERQVASETDGLKQVAESNGAQKRLRRSRRLVGQTPIVKQDAS